MPTGVYPRKPGLKRNYTPEQRAVMRERMKKIRELAKGRGDTPAMTAAKSKNARKAMAIRSARALLKHMPAGAVPGTVFKCSSCRSFRVIDAAPQQNGGAWEQRFEQMGSVSVYGVRHEFSGIVKIVWDYAPTMENIMESPRLIDEGKPSTE